VLYISPALAQKILKQLESKGFLKLVDDKTAKFQFSSTSEKSSLINLVIETYRSNLIEVTNLIHRKQDPLYHFSQAFKIGKED
jgi:hypothetical protein